MKYLFGVILFFVLAATAQAEPLRVAVISDLNGSYGSTKYDPMVAAAVNRIIALKPDLVIATGDLVAGQRRKPHLDDTEIAAMWTAFNATVTDPLTKAGIPVLPTPGNHDASAYDGFERERRAYDKVWTGRSPAVSILDGERYPFRYAVERNGVLLISLDVTRTGSLPVEETEWLQQMLREGAGRYRATVLFSHLPLYPFTQGRETEIVTDPALAKIVESGDVDVWLSGHHHGYYPGVKSGVLYLGQSCLGAGPRKLIGQEETAQRSFTMIEVADDGSITQYALIAPDFVDKVPLSSLPERIGPLVRRDLVRP